MENRTTLPLSFQPKEASAFLNQLKEKIKTNHSLSVDEVFAVQHNSLENAANSLSILRAGGSYKELKDAGFTDAIALRDCSIFYIQVDAERQLSENALLEVTSNYEKLMLFLAYLDKKRIERPNLSELAKSIRSNESLFVELRLWYKNGSGN